MPRAKKSKRKDGRAQIKRVIGHDATGKPINKWFSGKTKTEAIENFNKFKYELEKKELEKKLTPFEKWMETWLYTYKEPDIKESTFVSTYKRTCENHILPYFKGKILQNITQADVKFFINNHNQQSQSLIDKIMLCLNGIFETAIDNDLIVKNPCRNIKAKSKKEKNKKRTYDKESVEFLCNSEHEYSLIANIMLKMGLRPSELCGLRKENIDLNNGFIHIKEAITSESGKVYIDKPKTKNSIRKLPIHPELIEKLKTELEKNNNEYLISNGNRPITPSTLYHRIKLFYNYLKIPKELQISAHELRHTCGTLLYEETKDIYYVSRYLGHSDIGITTKIYIHSNLQENAIHLDLN